jgi:hypothetical protein
MQNIKCLECDKPATYVYLPNNKYVYCDDCISRSCSCNHNSICDFPIPDNYIENKNFKWVDDETWEELGEDGRPYPCCEYDILD